MEENPPAVETHNGVDTDSVVLTLVVHAQVYRTLAVPARPPRLAVAAVRPHCRVSAHRVVLAWGLGTQVLHSLLKTRSIFSFVIMQISYHFRVKEVRIHTI